MSILIVIYSPLPYTSRKQNGISHHCAIYPLRHTRPRTLLTSTRLLRCHLGWNKNYVFELPPWFLCSSLLNWSIRADVLNQSEQNPNLWTSKCQQSAPWPLLQAVNLKRANGPSMLGVNAVILAVVCKRIQQLITMLEPAVHRGKDATHKTLETTCNARAFQCLESCTNGSNIVALRLGDHGTNEMLGVVGSKVWPVSNFTRQLPTMCNRVCKRTQRRTSNNVGSNISNMRRSVSSPVLKLINNSVRKYKGN